MPPTGYSRINTSSGTASSAPKPTNLDDTHWNLSEYPIRQENVDKFKYIYDTSTPAFFGHQIATKIDGTEHKVTIPRDVAQHIVAQFMQDHPIPFYQMIQPIYQQRKRPNCIGKTYPQTCVYFNKHATKLGYHNLGRTLAYHGTQIFKEHELDYDDDSRPGCIDSIYTADMVTALAGEVNIKSSKGKGKFKKTPLGGGSMLLQDTEERNKLKKSLYNFDQFVLEERDVEDDNDDEDVDEEDDDDEMEDSGDEDFEEKNARRKSKGKISKKKKLTTKAPKKKTKNKKQRTKMMPHRRKEEAEKVHQKQVEEEEEVTIINQPRGRRASTARATALSEDRSNKTIKGIAQGSKKRKSLGQEFSLSYDDDNDDDKDANQSLDSIFGATTKKKWNQHPQYKKLEKTAANAVQKMGFSTPSKEIADTTMHRLARQLKLQLPNSRSPAEPVLINAIVVAKIKKIDKHSQDNYE